jgi:hypothetical protein
MQIDMYGHSLNSFLLEYLKTHPEGKQGEKILEQFHEITSILSHGSQEIIGVIMETAIFAGAKYHMDHPDRVEFVPYEPQQRQQRKTTAKRRAESGTSELCDLRR